MTASKARMAYGVMFLASLVLCFFLWNLWPEPLAVFAFGWNSLASLDMFQKLVTVE